MRKLWKSTATRDSHNLCYCRQATPGVWDQRGIAHGADVCRYTDRYITTRWAYREAPMARGQR